MNVLVVNAGSSSLKYQLFDTTAGVVRAKGLCERIGIDGKITHKRPGKEDYVKEDLFEPNDTIKIKEASFEAIVKELEVYNLSRTADDVKGIAFEKFLGKTFRGELGQFFTPRTIVDFMVALLDPEEGEIICDPCCGSG